MIGELQPQWLRQVNEAMDLPLDAGRRLLADVLAERRQRSAELRALAASGDVPNAQRRAYLGMAEWVDESVELVEQAAARLADLDAAGDVATGREQIDREIRSRGRGGGWSR